MRVSVPSIPDALLRAAAASSSPPTSLTAATARIARFLAPGNVAVVTGAGVSVDSGIRAYRGAKGRYLNPNYKPIFYHELMDASPKGAAFRRRYWLRSYLGYPPVRDALPNTTHYALAALQYASVVPKLITQNVDGLHHKALAHVWDEPRSERGILELHGRLRAVRCVHGHLTDRDTFQQYLSAANPQWKAFADELEATGQQPRTNPDGDVVLEGVQYDDFTVPDCPECHAEHRVNNIVRPTDYHPSSQAPLTLRALAQHKPEVIFFGESITKDVRDRSFHDIESCDRLFLVGTTLATFSAFSDTGADDHAARLLKHALDWRKPVLLLNVGPSRADALPGVEKIEVASGAVMRDVVRTVLGTSSLRDPVIADMLQWGIVKPPPEDENEIAPRAVG
ncbi:uncharacterized protein FIBRA_04635 [Fibroporia radiculosa]|uniref:Deacetylase sirtuin-type domain-containing protein n=1 Tax=Fibroporia radiculosa TaxID=599839 RepID=J4G7P5_9APHY|nr:uncharacterized protein FIBRA_04635 [Fibroporia radiculosa]CCM02533.1 predicted protein [Fibroporia radiculosa]